MDRTQPILSKILAKRWREKEQEIHHQKLKCSKASVDTSSPIRYKHVRSRVKSRMQKEERCIEIEKNNKLLLERMSKIMSKEVRFSKHKSQKSLNLEIRKKQLLNISNENQALLSRLTRNNSSYSIVALREDWEKKEQLVKNLCEYPYIINAPKGRRKRLSQVPRQLMSKEISIFGRRLIAEVQEAVGAYWVVAVDLESSEYFRLRVNKQNNPARILQMLTIVNGKLVLSDKPFPVTDEFSRQLSVISEGRSSESNK